MKTSLLKVTHGRVRVPLLAHALGLQVHVERRQFHELEVAVAADVWPLGGVLFLVFDQAVVRWKAAVAVGIVALEWALAIMYTHMSQQVSFFSKRLFTAMFWTYEGTFTCLETHVDLESAGP